MFFGLQQRNVEPKAARLKNSIEKNKVLMDYRIWEIVLYALLTMLFVVQVVIKNVHDKKLNESYNHMDKTNIIGNPFRSASWLMKESIRYELSKRYPNISMANYPNNTIYSISLTLHISGRVRNNFNGLDSIYLNLHLPDTIDYGSFQFNQDQRSKLSFYSLKAQLVMNFYLIIQQARKLKLDYFNDKLDALWRVLRVQSTNVNLLMQILYDTESDNMRENLSSADKYITFHAIIIGCTTIITIIFVGLIAWFIKNQISQVATLLLWMNKPKIVDAMRNIYRNATVTDSDPDQKFVFLRSQMRHRLSRLNLISTEAGSMSENMRDLDDLRDSKHMKLVHFGNPNHPGRHSSSSSYINPPTLSSKRSTIAMVFVSLVASIPNILIYILMIINHKFLQESMESLVKINNGSSSIQVFYSLILEYYDYKTTNNIDNFPPVSMALLTRSEKNLIEALEDQNEYSRTRYSNTPMCEEVIKISAPFHAPICKESVGEYSTFTVNQGFQAILTFYNTARQMAIADNPEKPESFYSYRSTAMIDYIVFYTVVATRSIGVTHVEMVNNKMIEHIRATKNLTVLSGFILVLLILFLRFVWIEKRLSSWNKLKGCFLSCSDTLVNNDHINKYFARKIPVDFY